MNDLVLIEGLKVETVIGAYDWERNIKQTLVLDIEMSWDIQKAAQTDDLIYCLDYAEISQKVIDYLESQQFELIESVAENIVALIFKEYATDRITLKVNKPGAVKAANNVAVKITRTRSQQ